MDFSYYFFAFFVFLLTALIVLLVKKVKGVDAGVQKSLNEKEKKMFKLYQNLEEMIAEAQDFIEAAKNDILADKKSINTMLEKADSVFMDAQNEIKNLQSAQKEEKTALEEKPAQPVQSAEPVNLQADLSRNEKVKILRKEGKNIEEISRRLGISQGEVALIIGLGK